MLINKANTTQHIHICALSIHEQKSTSTHVYEVSVYVCMQLQTYVSIYTKPPHNSAYCFRHIFINITWIQALNSSNWKWKATRPLIERITTKMTGGLPDKFRGSLQAPPPFAVLPRTYTCKINEPNKCKTGNKRQRNVRTKTYLLYVISKHICICQKNAKILCGSIA